MAARTVVGADGVRLHVTEQGSEGAPVVVLVHGYPDDQGVWSLVAADLAADHRVVAYDVRGAGRSEEPETAAGYRIEALNADLAAVLAAVSPDAPAHVVGHDWGSIQTWDAVTDRVLSRRFASYTTISGPGLDHVAAWTRAHRRPGGGRWRRALRQGVRSWYVVAMRTPLPWFVWRRGLAGRAVLANARHDGSRVDEAWPGPHLTRNGTNGVHLYRTNMFGRPHPRVPPTTDVPVLQIVLGRDRYVTAGLLEGTERIARDLTRRSLDAPHWAPRSHPHEVAGLVRAHVAEVEARR